jgi:four helix bundle protein
MSNYKKLLVWQKAYSFGVELYTVTKTFPKEELYGITSQLRRASISIPSNIAEGSRRSTQKDFKSFLHIAYGSGAELEVQILFARDFGYLNEKEAARLLTELEEIMRMLNAFIKKLS